MGEPYVVQIVGDGIEGNWMMWRWADGFQPHGVARVRGLPQTIERFKRALPQESGDLGFHGALTDATREAALMTEISGVLLPDELRCQLLACAEKNLPLHVRVAPTPLAAAVPWGLLPVDAERRLLDIADVSWIAPILPRDVAPENPRSDAPLPETPRALHVIDPIQMRGRVMGAEERAALAAHDQEAMTAPPRFGAADLATALQNGISRLLLVGHTHNGGSAPTTGFILSDLAHGASDALTAEEIIAEPTRWPMPPRVAVLACASGADMADHEPFGLATALLHGGADSVHATLWTLPTDHAFRLRGGVDQPVLLPMARAFADAQKSDDPVAALCAWQRERLRCWRASPSLVTSPLSWGSALTVTAPARSLRPAPSEESPS